MSLEQLAYPAEIIGVGGVVMSLLYVAKQLRQNTEVLLVSAGGTCQHRAMMFEWRAITNWNHWFQLRDQGLMPDAQWNELIWLIQNLGRRRALREAWRTFNGG